MEGRFKKFLTLRKPDRSNARVNASAIFAADDTEVEARRRADGLWRFFGTARDSPDSPRNLRNDAFQASPYEALPPGREPIVVGAPMHGNGPIRLQTNRRLATGELIPTQQDQELTLSDIRQGHYIVGTKESPKLSAAHSSPNLARRPISKDDIKRPEPLFSPKSAPIEDPSSFRRDSKISPLNSFERGRRPRAASNISRTGAFSPPVPRRSLSASPGRTSILSGPEDKNLALEALWKAENTRLAAVFGPPDALGGHSDPGFTEDVISQSATRRVSIDDRGIPGSRPFSPVSQHHYSPQPNSSPLLADNTSILSGSGRFTVRSPEPDSTRQDVRQMVENMRTTYLTAIETHNANAAKVQVTKKRRSHRSSRASNGTAVSENQEIGVEDHSSKRSSTRRPSHAGHIDQSPKTEDSQPKTTPVLGGQTSAQNGIAPKIPSMKSLPPTTGPPPTKLPPVPQDIEEEEVMEEIETEAETSPTPEAEALDEFADGPPRLARADSMTLGSLLDSNSPMKTRPRKPSKALSHEDNTYSVFPPGHDIPVANEVGPALLPVGHSMLGFEGSDAGSSGHLRPTTTSTVTTVSSSASCNNIPPSSASFSSVSSSLSTPISQPSTSPTPTIVPQTYLYNADDGYDNPLNFDVFFHDSSSGGDDGILRIIKPRKPKATIQPSSSSPMSPVPDLIASPDTSRGFAGPDSHSGAI